MLEELEPAAQLWQPWAGWRGSSSVTSCGKYCCAQGVGGTRRNLALAWSSGTAWAALGVQRLLPGGAVGGRAAHPALPGLLWLGWLLKSRHGDLFVLLVFLVNPLLACFDTVKFVVRGENPGLLGFVGLLVTRLDFTSLEHFRSLVFFQLRQVLQRRAVLPAEVSSSAWC